MPGAVSRLQAALLAESKKAGREVAAALEALARIHAERLTGSFVQGHEKALGRLAAALSRLQAAADLSGRLDIRHPTAKAPEPEDFAARPDVVAEVVPSVAFEEAILDLESRDPLGAQELQRAGLEVEDLYGPLTNQMTGEVWYPHGFSLARAADYDVAKRVKEKLVSGLAFGRPTQEIVDDLVRDWGFPGSYAANVVRTNFNTASTAGRFQEAQRVAGSGIPVGFRYSCVNDGDLRRGRPQDHGENHKALDGLVARQDDPIWDRFSPPGGYQCRCLLEVVVGEGVPEGFVNPPVGAAFAPGFGHRPDRQGAYR